MELACTAAPDWLLPPPQPPDLIADWPDNQVAARQHSRGPPPGRHTELQEIHATVYYNYVYVFQQAFN